MEYPVKEFLKPDVGRLRVAIVEDTLYAARVDLCKIVYEGHAPNAVDSVFSPRFSHDDKALEQTVIVDPTIKRGRKKIVFLKATDVIFRLSLTLNLVKTESRKLKRIALKNWLTELVIDTPHDATTTTQNLFYNHDLEEKQMQEKSITNIPDVHAEVTTFTVADIDDIKDRAEALKQAFDVSKSAALNAVIALKEEEIGRKLDALRELLKA